MSAEKEAPVPILTALDMLLVTLARGVPEGGPYWQTPPGGYTEVHWLNRKGTYRFTLDLMPPDPFPASVVAQEGPT